MRPHHLELTAFGPFAEHVEVDFDRLGRGGLFLMHGETGAGKTTVLDGISFALYGRLPGVRGINRVRSDHASPGTRTRVTLDVSIAGRRLRITRTPAQTRPKLRGAGATVEPASVALDEWDESVDGGWRSRSTRVGEVDAELVELLGMSADQFHQVVLLPQGRFAKFLHSDAAERTQLLQRLFGTDRFRRVEDWLAEQRRLAREALVDARHAVERVVSRIAQASGADEPDELPGPEWVQGQLAGAEAGAAEAAEQAAASRERYEAARGEAAAAADLARRQQRRAAALARQATLAADAPRIAAIESEIEAGRRAASVVEPLRAHAWREQQARAAAAELGQARDRLPEALRAVESAQLRAAADAGREELGRLREAAELEREVAAAQTEVKQLEGQRAAGEQRVQAIAPLLAAAPEQRERAAARLEAAREAALALPESQVAARLRADAVSAWQAADRADGECHRWAAEHLEARERAVAQREALSDLRNARIDGMIAELAATLVDAAPCPVCGSLDHPDPSEVRGRSVSRSDEEAAAAAAEQARERAEKIGEKLAAAQAARQGAAARLAELGCDGIGIDELQMMAEAANARIAELTAAAGDLAAAEADLAQLDAKEGDLREELARLEMAMSGLGERLDSAANRRRELAERLAKLLGDATDVATARHRTSALVEAIEAAQSAAQAAARAGEEEMLARGRAEQAAAAAGFASVAAAGQAVREPAALQALEEQVAKARQEAAAVSELLADPELAVAERPAAAVAEAQAAEQEALNALRSAERWLATAQDRVDQLRLLSGELAAQLAALQPVEAAAVRAKELADLAGGGGANRLNMPLSAYVLAARLEEVAEAASHRLRAMTQGRYTLVHSDAAQGNGRSGLRLLVSDAWTGQDRDTATLSGGETFLASLALALGLAETVTAAAGGAPLEALFVDEGFGTLDEETLDEVLDVLDGLREGGRLVGIVSHVPHLRDRIPSRLRVRKGVSGSTLQQYDGLAAAVEGWADAPPPVGELPVGELPVGDSPVGDAPVSEAPASAAPAHATSSPKRPAKRPPARRSHQESEQLALLATD